MTKAQRHPGEPIQSMGCMQDEHIKLTRDTKPDMQLKRDTRYTNKTYQFSMAIFGCLLSTPSVTTPSSLQRVL